MLSFTGQQIPHLPNSPGSSHEPITISYWIHPAHSQHISLRSTLVMLFFLHRGLPCTFSVSLFINLFSLPCIHLHHFDLVILIIFGKDIKLWNSLICFLHPLLPISWIHILSAANLFDPNFVSSLFSHRLFTYGLYAVMPCILISAECTAPTFTFEVQMEAVCASA